MVIGVLGKGGSGKTTVSTQLLLFLHSRNNTVLGIDADHNMDFSYNILAGFETTQTYLSASMPEIFDFLDFQSPESYSEIFCTDILKRFTLSPSDVLIMKFSTKIREGMFLMAAGPQTDAVLHGKACSHVLTTPLKVYLPLLELTQNEFVVVDEKAGADGVTTGIVTGFDVGLIICEPTLHSIKTAQQIANLMDFYKTPYLFIGNKIESEDDAAFILEELHNAEVHFLPQIKEVKRSPSLAISSWTQTFNNILEKAKLIQTTSRLNRTINKFSRNREFAKTI